jgi:hypothetical protein
MTEIYKPQNLFAGDYPKVTDTVVVALAGVLVKGTVLGKITAGGKFIKCSSVAVDGSQAPVCILAEDIDTTAADVNATVYLSGCFDENQLVYGGADTAATHRAALRNLNIYTKKAVA